MVKSHGSGDNSSYFSNANDIQIHPSRAVTPTPTQRPVSQIFAAGPSAINDFRNPILGLDTRDGGNGNLIGLPYWNMDFSVRKNIKVAESVSLNFKASSPMFSTIISGWIRWAFSIWLFSGQVPGGFGTLSGGSAQEEPGGDRQIELGLRIRF